jgi:hypothetical protein
MGKGKEQEVTVDAVYSKDSKRYKTFSVGAKGEKIVGTLYVAKGEKVPECITVCFREEE